ncbi:hypothetical protein [Brevundimonas sp. NPDC058933]|uniref:hypothetical protein n=1 Tax=Brevundimonas sp. NPDC058933 TaxID=3346673 RepID=UPI003BEED841
MNEDPIDPYEYFWPQTLNRETLKAFFDGRKDDTHGLRLGQHFVAVFCRSLTWPELFYEEDEAKARTTILDYVQEYWTGRYFGLERQAQLTLQIRDLQRRVHALEAGK